MTDLDGWRDSQAASAIVDFVDRVTADGADYVEPADRVAVFDNDGTLWCEKPAYVQLHFVVRRLAEQAAADASLVAQAPYAAAASGDLGWFGDAVTAHYRGDDAQLKLLGSAMLSAFQGMTVEEHEAKVRAFFAEAQHPTLNRPYTACGYTPMVGLLRYLEANGFTTYIASGGGRDFMRPVTGDLYGIPPERVIGSSVGLDFTDGHLITSSRPEFLNDGPVKPVRIWERVGRRPILVAGNSNGDIEMLDYACAGSRPALALLVRHDDADREFAYDAGAERALHRAGERGWTVTSMREDWAAVFSET
jgi:phosphoglycolate phosphatase-like HAD superfamily hydrolase